MFCFFRKKMLPAILFLLVVVVAGCKKDRDPVNYSISYSGSQYLGGALYFTTTAPANSSFLWDFGDSTSSSGFAPTHSYAHAGIFNVSLVVNGDAANIQKKTVYIGVDSVHQALANGRWTCHVQDEGYDPISMKYTVYHYNDTSISVNSIEPGLLLFKADTLSYSSSTDSTLVFPNVHYANSTIPYSAFAWSRLTYNYVANKIIYTYERHLSAASGNWTYTYTGFK